MPWGSRAPPQGRAELLRGADDAAQHLFRRAPVHARQVYHPVRALQDRDQRRRVAVGADGDHIGQSQRAGQNAYVPAEEPVRAGDHDSHDALAGRESSARISGSVSSSERISGTPSRCALSEL
ncbi:hypothetical protein Psuf_011560 [Phytohabitans suffuscus]|uniref:Uncharacterized protein n=1 Tax=Phytohabitans suffuscus TaxID=624315 RepID=A0A6F8YCT5_9ACTN|nr:hypothetical protein Psuf_011560 [Phytohabitans suffuscus]